MKRLYALGPEGSYGHQAALQLLAGAYLDYDLRLLSKHAHVIEHVRAERQIGLVAVENSTGGYVSEVLKDFWLHQVRPDIQVVGELRLPVQHCIACRQEFAEKDLDLAGCEVLSHPQALTQCSAFITSHKLKEVPMSSTSEAFRLVAADSSTARRYAIGSVLAAETYGLHVVAKGVQDEPNNATRFHVLGHDTPRATGKDRTAVICFIKDEPASLHRLTGVTAQEGIQMSFPHAIPTGTLDVYGAYFTFDEHRETERGARLLAWFTEVSERMLIMGSYPQEKKGGAA